MEPRIPDPLAAVVGSVLGACYYHHETLNTLLMEHGAPGSPPEGSCERKCVEWLKRASADPKVDAYEVLGGVLRDFMDDTYPSDKIQKDRERVRNMLAKCGLSYHPGGKIVGGKIGAPTRTLETILRGRNLREVEIEFDRALKNVDTDPGAAVTAACAIVEALCKVYIEDEGLELPTDQTVKPLWKVVRKHLKVDPADIEDDDLKPILSGLISIVEGVAAFRTHVGSAHGHGRKSYRPEPRHARLAVHTAHTLATFVIETWSARKASGS